MNAECVLHVRAPSSLLTFRIVLSRRPRGQTEHHCVAYACQGSTHSIPGMQCGRRQCPRALLRNVQDRRIRCVEYLQALLQADGTGGGVPRCCEEAAKPPERPHSQPTTCTSSFASFRSTRSDLRLGPGLISQLSRGVP